MNEPIARLFVFVVLLFALLVAFTSRWTNFQAASLRSNSLNARPLLEQRKIDRGAILASDGTVLAHSVAGPHAHGSELFYERSYPSGTQFAHAVGYWNIELGSTGVERFRNEELSGQTGTNLQRVLDQLQGRRSQGNEVITTLVPAAQRVANSALAGREGAIVALQPRTGAVQVMASSPSFNPNALRSPNAHEALLAGSPGRPLVNRATQFGYAPGSTFKVITATAAIDSGRFTPQSQVDGKNDVKISGVPLQNDYNQSFGMIDLTTALAKSVNTVYAQVAERLGKATMKTYMERFGFDNKPQLDYPAEQMSTSGEYGPHGNVLSPTSRFVDVGRMGIGQDKLEVTPVQMAEVVAAVANGGKLMKPHFTDRVVDTDGRTVEHVSPEVQSTVMKPSTASALTAMMEGVVNNGTGTQAQIPGVRVAGKTGTAETQIGKTTNNVWFVAFAPADRPRVAIAVTMEHQIGFGGDVAAPVAKAVMESLLK